MINRGVVAESATTPMFNLPEIPESSTCKQSLQVALTEALTRHAFSFNTERNNVGYVICRCGLNIRLDGSSTYDDKRTFAAHQAEMLAQFASAGR